MRPEDPPFLSIDPLASTDQLWVNVFTRHGNACLSRREVERLKHQLERWLAWDREKQGTPRTWHMRLRDHYPAAQDPAP